MFICSSIHKMSYMINLKMVEHLTDNPADLYQYYDFFLTNKALWSVKKIVKKWHVFSADIRWKVPISKTFLKPDHFH